MIRTKFIQPIKKTIYFWIIFQILSLISCQKTDLSPIIGTYIGNCEIEKWGFEELTDNEGNFVGIIATRDTTFSMRDTFLVVQINKDARFSVLGTGGLSRINTYSNHEFSYDGQSDFNVVSITNGVKNQSLEFTFDGSGNVELFYFDEQMVENRPPIGHRISFLGSFE